MPLIQYGTVRPGATLPQRNTQTGVNTGYSYQAGNPMANQPRGVVTHSNPTGNFDTVYGDRNPNNVGIPNPMSGRTSGDSTSGRWAPNYAPMEIPYLPGMEFGDINDINKVESKAVNVGQRATNVYNWANRLLEGGRPQQNSPLQWYSDLAQGVSGIDPNLQTQIGTTENPVSRTFLGMNALRDALGGGIDYFGRLGMSEGTQNLRAQENAANRALQDRLGRTSGNASLIAALQNQNRMRTQLAQNPLMAEAQRGTYERALGNVALENQKSQLINNLLGTEASFRNQAALSNLDARIAQLGPLMNYIEALSALQGQARGVESTERTIGGKNYS